MEEIQEFETTFSRLYTELENSNSDAEQEVYDLEISIQRHLEYAIGNQKKQLVDLLYKIAEAKKEFDFYDEEGTLDMMFPDRHDDDFDEDSMSYESTFGDE